MALGILPVPLPIQLLIIIASATKPQSFLHSNFKLILVYFVIIIDTLHTLDNTI